MAETSTVPELEAGTSAPPSGGRSASDLRDLADSLRNRVDLFGKTLAAIATLGTTAVGLSEVGDMLPTTSWGWVLLACAALALAAGSAIWIAVRLMSVARPVFVSSDLQGLTPSEGEEVRPVFEAAASRFGYRSMIGLEERERSLRSAAARAATEEERARRTALADDVKGEIEQALARGQLVVVRRRATDAVSDVLARWLYVFVIAGLILFAVASDAASSDRTDRVAAAKACGEAREAGATEGELKRTNEICDAKAANAAPGADPPTASVARATLAAELATTLKACAEFVGEAGAPDAGPLSDEDCAPIRDTITEMLSD
jgi:hypothetical protein